MLITKLLLGHTISVLQGVQEDDTEGEACADEQDCNVHQVQVVRDVGRVAFVGQIRNRINSKQTHREEYWPEGHIHELSDIIDNLVEPLAEFIAAHQCHSQYEAYRG